MKASISLSLPPASFSDEEARLNMEDDGELVFIAAPTMGQLVAQVEVAKRLISHRPGLFISIHILKLPNADPNLVSYLQDSGGHGGRISFPDLPPLETPEDWPSKPPLFLFDLFGCLYKPIVKRLLLQSDRRRRIIGILTNMLIPHFVDVADELGLPSYLLYTSGANSLAVLLSLDSLSLPPKRASLEVSGFRNPIPLSVWPDYIHSEAATALVMTYASRYRKSKGILVNTFAELEPEILASLSRDVRNPPVYAVGPMLDLGRREINSEDRLTMSWLDAQPPASVVFLCFGSMGSFEKEQLDQISAAVERTGHRFLWSLRRQPISDKGKRMPSDYDRDDFGDILPAGFLDRTSGFGKMIGWAPQVEVLAHPAVGAFVSHCGWNSVLESLLFGVPVVTWPMYAEQQRNAFYMVRELEIAVELTIDYKYDLVNKKGNMVVNAAEVERAIKKLMDDDEEGAAVRFKVKIMSEFAKKAADVGGCSHNSLQLFTQDLMKNLNC